MNVPFDMWGSGNGPALRLLPQTRMLCGTAVFTSCMLLPFSTSAGTACAVGLTALWCLLCGMPLRRAVLCLGIAGALFVPILLMTPWIQAGDAHNSAMAGRLAASGTIALRASLCLFISFATITALPLSEAHTAFAGLPLPRTAAVLLVQMLNQTLFLIEETGRVIRAIRLRGAGRGLHVRLLFSFPVVWMGRMLFRAERTAMAMTMRGYTVRDGLPASVSCYAGKDILMLVTTGCIAVGSLVLRILS
ncbi:MAG: hypothetical protein A2268_14565 [Candidatus Raymondbacteria bacterium RifOxyA12_full_50_37]|uniref:Cobalt ECF transporter T component CbiQ n=1 Tax=Candidatus Raymondbacteria bacterium RIFOXYD12_FULL_49_13 TaxID=1817890 RepID=A0A1F7F2C2_UNCRA|nr:MAG: hypothetical protein A2268_14565 [Candidatus Raymondbacteria bacterium RifOxyA12_full_50_37]OGJ88642.1 MAG: hypothetical protein A2248_20500 [Candidatus Raymondbacteria bacterium RIFOXYA2_FULL_49_16]OGJ90506.1 MAG: hypothetical protein A2350_18650 [Candidatus Raymondbacteria bacterium RifOxyB12_full_50_8]OGK00814.1 MAG: hypothetical protein A2519_07755 [Candidatus Raymondbacteria bacterium RIFOXYD12_FULL_49_13]OGK02883.1 MAG: hypothetical protein A2487_17810 [Candidatus Raymondbacteria 